MLQHGACRTCNERPCTGSRPQNFGLVFGTWRACNSTCGVGHQTRDVTCQSQDGFLGSLSQCDVDPAGEYGLVVTCTGISLWQLLMFT